MGSRRCRKEGRRWCICMNFLWEGGRGCMTWWGGRGRIGWGLSKEGKSGRGRACWRVRKIRFRDCRIFISGSGLRTSEYNNRPTKSTKTPQSYNKSAKASSTWYSNSNTNPCNQTNQNGHAHNFSPAAKPNHPLNNSNQPPIQKTKSSTKAGKGILWTKKGRGFWGKKKRRCLIKRLRNCRVRG